LSQSINQPPLEKVEPNNQPLEKVEPNKGCLAPLFPKVEMDKIKNEL
jgi:hypothetical protein